LLRHDRAANDGAEDQYAEVIKLKMTKLKIITPKMTTSKMTTSKTTKPKTTKPKMTTPKMTTPKPSAAVRGVTPRKAPAQPRSALTVAAILEGAAQVLEEHGLAGYTTNAIAARAGVSIGSLYQYFPTKDAVTVALIERERVDLVREATAALALADRGQALHGAIEVAVRHQLRRPTLAAVLDVEQVRLSAIVPPSGQGVAVHAALVEFLRSGYPAAGLAPALAAAELMALISSLTDAAGRSGVVEPAALVARIEGAVLGYLGAL
jgi:AcrR family transcriptional regulator